MNIKHWSCLKSVVFKGDVFFIDVATFYYITEYTLLHFSLMFIIKLFDNIGLNWIILLFSLAW